MPIHSESPYLAHVFVCTNDRGGVRKACADHDSPRVKAALKEAAGVKGWKGRVRVSSCGCMGLCTRGPNVMIYPQKIWFSDVAPVDVAEIVTALESLVADGCRDAELKEESV